MQVTQLDELTWLTKGSPTSLWATLDRLGCEETLRLLKITSPHTSVGILGNVARLVATCTNLNILHVHGIEPHQATEEPIDDGLLINAPLRMLCLSPTFGNFDNQVKLVTQLARPDLLREIKLVCPPRSVPIFQEWLNSAYNLSNICLYVAKGTEIDFWGMSSLTSLSLAITSKDVDFDRVIDNVLRIQSLATLNLYSMQKLIMSDDQAEKLLFILNTTSIMHIMTNTCSDKYFHLLKNANSAKAQTAKK